MLQTHPVVPLSGEERDVVSPFLLGEKGWGDEFNEEESSMLGQTISHCRILEKSGKRGMGVVYIGYTLSDIVKHSQLLRQIRKTELVPGDRLFVKTRNSVYDIQVLESGMYSVSGGWFDKKGLSPMKLGIAGCTWGGSAIKVDIVAACGLRLEFQNRLVTSTIQKIIVLPVGSQN